MSIDVSRKPNLRRFDGKGSERDYWTRYTDDDFTHSGAAPGTEHVLVIIVEVAGGTSRSHLTQPHGH